MKISWCVWGGWFAAFLGLELPAAMGKTKWKTLSTTIHDLIDRTDGVAAIAIVGGLSILTVHLVAPDVFESKKKGIQ